MSSSILDLTVALEALFLSDPALSALIGREGVYLGLPPRTAALPYLVLGESADAPYRAFKAVEGAESTEVLNLWGESKYIVLQMYGHIRRLLQGRKLTLPSHTHHQGRVRLVATLMDADGAAYHGVVHYTSTLAPRRP